MIYYGMDQMERCFICGKQPKHDGIGTGYGYDAHGHKLCYRCIGILDKRRLERMSLGQRTDLYITKKTKGDISNYYVSNWPGTFKHHAIHLSDGRHNIAGIQRHYWFCIRSNESNDGKTHAFHGVCFGDNTEILHCRKVKFEPLYR